QPFRQFVNRNIRKNGEIVWLSTSAVPILDEKGTLLGYRGADVDITKRKRAEDALRESEAFRSGLLANSPIPVAVINPDGSIRYVSPALEKLTGFSAQELIGRTTPYPYWPRERRQKIMEGFRRAMSQGSKGVVELYQRKNGEKFWVEITSTPVKEDGKFQYLLASWVDITERERAEETLRESEARYRAVIEGAHDMIQSISLNGRIIFVNKSWRDTLGYTEAELSSLNLFDIIHPDSLAHCRELFAEVRSGKSVHGIEAVFLTKDGRKILVEGNAAPRYIGKKVVASQGIFRDVTESKQAEAALKESEEKYKTLAEATSDIIWEADEKGTFTFVSPKIKDVLGYEVNEVVGKMRTLDLIPKREARKWLKKFKEVNAKRTPFFGFEIAHLHKNGTYVIFETSGIPLFDSAGNLKGFVGINKDITERRQMQEQLVIADRLASVGELAAGIAHELNNPLTGVIGFSQLLLDKEMPDDVRQDMQVVHNEAQRAAQVVKNLLTFARKHTAAKEKVNINDIINKVLELRAYEQKLENITVDARLDANLPEVMADYFQLQQVFLNIVINAEYFMKEANHKGNLTIATEKVGNKIRASFADDGPGIADENLGHLFDPFFTTKEVGRGTGLGLSICHGIVAEHGGRIHVESELGKGTAFIVELAIGAAERKGGAA
ncbi:MAG: PAS domain S-box protein, partial [Chloroflexi bacterium]|nr:PAS domain S-box protein [Chloroflexota bacterium]